MQNCHKLIDSEMSALSFAVSNAESETCVNSEVYKIGKQGGEYSQKIKRKQSQAEHLKPTFNSNKKFSVVLVVAGITVKEATIV